MWHGQNDIAGQGPRPARRRLQRDAIPTIKVNATTGGVVADQMRQKITDRAGVGLLPRHRLHLRLRPRQPRTLRQGARPHRRREEARLRLGRLLRRPRATPTTVDGKVRALPALIDSTSRWSTTRSCSSRRACRAAARTAGRGTTSRPRRSSSPTRRRARSAPRWPAVGDEDTVWRIWPIVWQAGGDVLTEDGKVGFGGRARRAGVRRRRPARPGRLGLRRHQARQRPDVPAVQQRQDRHGRDRAVAAAGLHRREDRLRRRAAADVRRRAADDLRRRTRGRCSTTATSARRPRSSSCSGSTQPEQDAKWDTKAGCAAAAQGAPPSSRCGRTTRRRSRGLSVFLDGLDGRAREPTIRAYPQISRGDRAGDRRRAARSGRRRRRRWTQAVQASEGVLAGGRLSGAVRRPPSTRAARPRPPSGSSARRRPRGCGSRPRS